MRPKINKKETTCTGVLKLVRFCAVPLLMYKQESVLFSAGYLKASYESNFFEYYIK